MTATASPAGTTLAILAGGEGSRMGCAKAGLRINGRPILEFLLDRMGWAGPTMLVTAPGREQPPGHARFTLEVIDPAPGIGPLRGLLTALEFLSTPLLLVMSVDMPGIGPLQLDWLLSQADSQRYAVGFLMERVAPAGPLIEPFPSLYRAEARQRVAAHLDSGVRSVHSLTKLPGIVTVRAPAEWATETWANLNTPEDLARLQLLPPTVR